MKELATALNAFQAELVTVGKGKANPFFKSKYAPLDEIMKAAQPVLTKHGLAVVQLPSHLDGAPALRTVVMHTSGESVEDVAPLLLAKDDPQGQGSAITYMRRYAYAAALGIVIDEDDDGNRAAQARQAAPQKTWTEVRDASEAGRTAAQQPTSIRVTEGQVKLLLARARDASGLTEREDILGWFHDNFGDPTQVLKTDVNRILEDMSNMSKDQPMSLTN